MAFKTCVQSRCTGWLYSHWLSPDFVFGVQLDKLKMIVNICNCVAIARWSNQNVFGLPFSSRLASGEGVDELAIHLTVPPACIQAAPMCGIS